MPVPKVNVSRSGSVTRAVRRNGLFQRPDPDRRAPSCPPVPAGTPRPDRRGAAYSPPPASSRPGGHHDRLGRRGDAADRVGRHPASPSPHPRRQGFAASMCTSPWRATAATAPGAKPESTQRSSTSCTRASRFDEETTNGHCPPHLCPCLYPPTGAVHRLASKPMAGSSSARYHRHQLAADSLGSRCDRSMEELPEYLLPNLQCPALAQNAADDLGMGSRPARGGSVAGEEIHVPAADGRRRSLAAR